MGEGPFELVIGGDFHCTPAWTSDWAAQPDYKCYFPRLGTASYTLEGGPATTLRAGRIYLIPGLQRQRYDCARRMDLDWIHFRPADLAWARHLACVRTVVEWPVQPWSWWRPTWRGIATWQSGRDPVLALRLHALIQCLVADACARAPARMPTDLDSSLAAAVQRLEADGPPPPLIELARLAGRSASRFHRAFSAAFGCTPHAWLTRRRLARAGDLLLDPTLSVAAVAERCGYDNQFYFSRAFKRHHGQSPEHWRRGRSLGP
ncbi:MAG: helix-turn-helix transcriptional regulator [Planctomycetes bacterium]|nr:helix-turn-helix transcriptional regulator [Planctomycetota bacterium]